MLKISKDSTALTLNEPNIWHENQVYTKEALGTPKVGSRKCILTAVKWWVCDPTTKEKLNEKYRLKHLWLNINLSP